MIHSEVFEKFCVVFPLLEVSVKEWFPNGRNSIRIRLETGYDFIFSSNSQDDWRLESVSSFLKEMKGGIAHG